MTKTKEKKILIKWVQEEMIDFILPIEKETHIELLGERFHIKNSIPLDIEVMLESLHSLPEMEMKKAIINTYLIRPWQYGIMIRYPELFADEEIEFAKMVLKEMGIPICSKRTIINGGKLND